MSNPVHTGLRVVPPLEPNRELILPEQTERTLPNGLTVIAIERRSVPLVEVRLRIPFGRATIDPPFLAISTLLSQTILSGTATMSTVEIAAALQTVGGALSASVDADRLLLSGTALGTGLDRILEIVNEVLTGATYPENEVTTERARLIDRLQVALTQPAHLARVALLKRVYGEHPYAIQTPEISDVGGVGQDELMAMHAARIHSAGAVLVLVGDFEAARVLDAAESSLGSWDGAGAAEELAPVPPFAGGPVTLANRPDSVQSSLRIALPAVNRTHPDHAALQLANLIFGGYFSSRWVLNIREDKGYSYGPHSYIDHAIAGSTLIASAEVATEVSGPALLETWYELGRMATTPPDEDELEQARQYALGSLLLGMSTQAGLAGLATTYAGSGLRLDYLAEHAIRLAAASRDDVARVAATHLAPTNGAVVILGDGDVIEPSLTKLSSVERTSG